jgi:hypothetical protein
MNPDFARHVDTSVIRFADRTGAPEMGLHYSRCASDTADLDRLTGPA